MLPVEITDMTIDALATALSALPEALKSDLPLVAYAINDKLRGPSIRDTMDAWNALPSNHPLKLKHDDSAVQLGYQVFPISRQLTTDKSVDELVIYVSMFEL